MTPEEIKTGLAIIRALKEKAGIREDQERLAEWENMLMQILEEKLKVEQQ